MKYYLSLNFFTNQTIIPTITPNKLKKIPKITYSAINHLIPNFLTS